jgi:hypothetical protein
LRPANPARLELENKSWILKRTPFDHLRQLRNAADDATWAESGTIKEICELPPGAIASEDGLVRIVGKCTRNESHDMSE